MTVRTALYRHFDADGELLYVGISLDTMRRLLQHKGSEWQQEIAKVEIEWLPTREAALRAEADAITTEQPLWNRRGAGKPVENPWYAVLEIETDMYDGFYLYRHDAARMVGFWNEVRSEYRHTLVTADRIGRGRDQPESRRLQNAWREQCGRIDDERRSSKH
jgi:predicted GIY-YIG superfamily endonuclease